MDAITVTAAVSAVTRDDRDCYGPLLTDPDLLQLIRCPGSRSSHTARSASI